MNPKRHYKHTSIIDDSKSMIVKSTGTMYNTHIDDMYEELENFYNCFPSIFVKYKEVTGLDLYELLKEVIELHDYGKNDEWVDYLKSNNISKIKFRHEVNSIIRANVKLGIENISDVVKVAILSHHGYVNYKSNLEHKTNNDKLTESVKYLNDWYKRRGWSLDLSKVSFMDELKKLDNAINISVDFPSLTLEERKEKINIILKSKFKYSVVRGLLMLFDWRASAKIDNEYIPKFEKFEYNFQHPTKRKIQDLMDKNWDNELTILKGNTGSGKTEAATIWADHQIKSGKASRLIFIMPTRFTANVISANTKSYVEGTSLYHSSSFRTLIANNSKTAFAEHMFSKTLSSPLCVTTIDYIMSVLLNYNEQSHIAFSNLCGSCVVIDEVDFHDEFTQASMEQFLLSCRELKIPILIMSATIPQSHLDYYKNMGFNIDKIYEDDDNLDIKKYNIETITEYNDLSEIDQILIKSYQEPTIIYVNTVDDAINMYLYIRDNRPSNYSDNDIVVYHSRFTESDKLKKEKKIIELLGKDAHQNGTAKGIVIMTQIGEMSINISSKNVISMICPIEKLRQRLGRGCRFDDEVCNVFIIIKYDDKGNLYPYPYINGFKNRVAVPNDALNDTILNLSENRIYTPRELNDIVDKIYSGGIIYSSQSEKNAYKYISDIKNNWLFTGSVNDDDLESCKNMFWQSRNIGNTFTIFVKSLEEYKEENPKYFLNDTLIKQSYYNFYRDECSISVNMGINKVEKLYKNGILMKNEVKILNDDSVFTVYIISNSDIYTYETGLNLLQDDGDIQSGII